MHNYGVSKGIPDLKRDIPLTSGPALFVVSLSTVRRLGSGPAYQAAMALRRAAVTDY
jgi:hypothetical protein